MPSWCWPDHETETWPAAGGDHGDAEVTAPGRARSTTLGEWCATTSWHRGDACTALQFKAWRFKACVGGGPTGRSAQFHGRAGSILEGAVVLLKRLRVKINEAVSTTNRATSEVGKD